MTYEKMIPIDEKTPRNDFDNPWKEALSLYFQDFMECCFPHIAEEIDWGRGHEFFDKELQTILYDAKVGNRIADKLVKVSKKNEDQAWILCHTEVHGDRKKTFPEHMMVYHYRIRDKHKRPIISIAILIDDHPLWRISHYHEDCYGCSFQLNYLVIKLLDYQKKRQELESMNNRFATIILSQLAVLETQNNPSARLQAKVELVNKLFQKDFTEADIYRLFRLVDWIIKLPEKLDLEYKKQVKFLFKKGENQMVYISTLERIFMEEGFEKGLKAGMDKGIQKGMQEGRQEGRMLGLQEGEAALLIYLLKHRYDELSSHYLSKIQQADQATLFRWSARVFDSATLEEVFD